MDSGRASSLFERAETLAWCNETIAQDKRPAFQGIMHSALARIQLFQGLAEQAAQTARRAVDLMVIMPPYRPLIFVTLIEALLQMGRTADTCAAASESLAALACMDGRCGYGEVDLRLAVATAYEAALDPPAARAAIQLAHAQLELRANRIPDAAMRRRYLTDNPKHLRILSMAAALQ